MAFQKTPSDQKSIASQNAANAAGTVYAALVNQGVITDWDQEKFEAIRGDIFKGTLALTLADVVVANADGTETSVDAALGEAAAEATPRRSFGGSKPAAAPTGNPGAFVVKFGQYNGQSIADIYDQKPEYVTEFLAEKTNNPAVKAAARKFVATLSEAA